MDQISDGQKPGGALGSRAAAPLAAVGWLEDQMRRLRRSMTPGQRWTVALGVAYVIVVVTFGAPTRTVVVDEAAAAPAPTAGTVESPAGSSSAPAATAPAAPAADATAPSDYPATAAPVGPAPTGSTPPPGLTLAPEPLPPQIVAVVRPAEAAGMPGRDDAAVAAAFLEGAAFEPTVVPQQPDHAAQCAEIAVTANVAIAGEGLGDLTECLVAAGVTVLSFDERGGIAATGVSTRRGTRDSLVDLGRWGLRSGALRGKVGLVGTAPAEPAIGRAVADLRRLGVDVVATAYLPDDPSSTVAMGDSVRAFASAGVEVVVFATSVAQQRQWAAQQAVLQQGVRYVVSDVADGVRDETYAPVFEGALAHTSLRVPWFARDHGETAVQAACRQRWEQAVGGEMQASETVRVFAWCQHVQMVDAALLSAQRAARARGAMDADTSFDAAVRALTLPSPLTADLAPLPGGGYGPSADAVLVWRASCLCWTEQRPFTARSRT